MLGAVEVAYPGRVWVSQDRGESTQAKLACVFAGLMLYQPPSED